MYIWTLDDEIPGPHPIYFIPPFFDINVDPALLPSDRTKQDRRVLLFHLPTTFFKRSIVAFSWFTSRMSHTHTHTHTWTRIYVRLRLYLCVLWSFFFFWYHMCMHVCMFASQLRMNEWKGGKERERERGEKFSVKSTRGGATRLVRKEIVKGKGESGFSLSWYYEIEMEMEEMLIITFFSLFTPHGVE